MENVFFLADENGVAGVIAALGAHDDIGLLGEHVDDFTFAFVTPLGAHKDRIGHSCLRYPDSKKPRNRKFGAHARYLRADHKNGAALCQQHPCWQKKDGVIGWPAGKRKEAPLKKERAFACLSVFFEEICVFFDRVSDRARTVIRPCRAGNKMEAAVGNGPGR